MSSYARLIRGLSRSLPLLAVALATTGAGPASANPAGDQAYRQYHEAIHTAVLCEGRDFELGVPSNLGAMKGEERLHNLPLWSLRDETGAQAAYERMEAAILQKTGRDAVTGDHLSMIDEGKEDARRLVASKGCRSAEAQGLLALFHKDLEPVLPKG